MTPPIALQLYTLREEMAQDFEGVLRQVAELGYVGVELAGTGGRSAAEVRALLDKYGLKASSAHVPLEVLESDLNKAIEEAKTIGYSIIAVPFLMPNRRGDRDGYLKLAALLDSIGAELKKHGLQLAYHNHDFEFVQFDGEYALDLIYANTDPENLKVELDVYWVQYAGVDPVAYVRKYADRAPLIHLKDMTNDEERFFAEVGEGTVDIDGVIAAATGMNREIENAGLSLGASPLTVFRRITLPMLMAGIMGGWMLSFIQSFDELTMTIFVATPGTMTLPVAMYNHIAHTIDPLVTSVSAVLIFGTVILTLLLERLVGLEKVLIGRG